MEPGERKASDDRRSERKAEKRLAILDGAIKVFAEKGFFNTTVAEVARAAGVADGTIYLYFKSKDELLLSVFDEKMEQLCNEARAAITNAPTAGAALRRICETHLRAVQLQPHVAAVLIVELRQSNAFVRDVEKPRLAEYLQIIADVVRRGQANGEFRADAHPGAVKRALFGALDEIALGWLLAKRKFDLTTTARQTADMFVRGLSREPQPALAAKS